MYTFSVCVLLGHWGQLHLPFSQGQPADTLGPQTLSQRLGERMEKYEYKYLHSDLHVQLLALAVCIIGGGGFGRACFADVVFYISMTSI